MKYRNDLKKRVLAGLFAGAALCLAAPAALAANSPIPNNTLPSGGSFVAGGDNENIVTNQAANRVDITQTGVNAVIKWDSFNVGANATVTFEKADGGKFNTLNYVTDKGGMSQIYGNINAENGNIYIVNPAGVEIGNSAQINVGSLYVSNRNLDDALKNLTDAEKADPNITNILNAGTTTDAALMSLGNINATNVTFDGNRIVIDTERLKDASGDKKLNAGNIIVRTNAASNVVIGYDAYDDKDTDKDGVVDGYKNAKPNTGLASVYVGNSDTPTKVTGYMWVEDVEQLQAIDTNLGGNYALRNSIDATATQDWNGTFNPLGGNGSDGPFTGKFDGLDYNIFNLNIKKDTDNVGLFGVVGEGAVINNVTLVGGSITGQNNVGALAGSVQGGAHISNITNSASVTGSSNVGGLIGSAGNSVFENLVNTGTVASTTEDTENNAGGLIGSLSGGILSGTSYNLGGVTGNGYNVGGLVGKASDATLGDGTNLIYNRLNVSGAYNVGGIVGSMTDTTVQNAENSGNVTATGHTTEAYKYHTAHTFNDENVDDNGVRTETVNIANAGGIAGTASGGSKISDVQNSGDVSSGIDTKDNGGYTFYTAGNVGGIVGRAENTNITDATNTENDVRGAHNVGGIAGYFGSTDTENTDVTYTITRGVNNGGDILATGAVDEDTKESTTSNELTRKDGFITEYVRGGSQGSEQSIIGNIGGIAGYMYGDNVYIASSANRGTVHSQDISTEKVLPVNQAANAGGIVGKIDRNETLKRGDGQSWEAALTSEGSSTKYDKAAVSNSYSTGDVRGYMGVGGIAGMMYNGEIAGSYNLGTVNTTRNQDSFKQGNYFAVNMGGIVGDTTEETDARAVLYDVYNKGQIGDETFNYYARHVGGVVGRLSGAVEKAYNTGAIYNGYSIVGGIVGWLNAGSVTNSFNTGNITVWNHDGTEASNVGGIAGDVNRATGDIVLTNVYNLGTLRSINAIGGKGSILGGIVGAIHGYHGNVAGTLKIFNAYTTGNLYSDGTIGSILGNANSKPYDFQNTYYISPAAGLPFRDLSTSVQNNANGVIAFNSTDGSLDKDDAKSYDGFKFTSQSDGEITGSGDWRIYAGSTPILNAFLPNTENYFSDTSEGKNPMAGISSIQYGTAYDPLLTIIKADEDLTFDWQKLGANNAAGIAVYGAGLTLDNFKATGGSGYFGGMIYSDGALSIESENNGDVALGSASQLYGSSVSISADGNVTIYGSVTATGNVQDGTSWSKDENKYTGKIAPTDGSVSISGGSVDIYGQLTSADGQPVKVPGINGMAAGWSPETDGTSVSDPKNAMSDIGDRFGYTTQPSDTPTQTPGNISITAVANDAEDGHVNVYYGNKGEGIVTTGGDLTVTASGDIYMDSDLSIGGNLTLNAGYKEGEDKPAADSEAVLDISNIGKVQAANDAPESKKTSVDYLHKFMHHFAKNAQDGGIISFTGGESKIAVDMWDETANEWKGGFNLKKYDDNNGNTLAERINALNLSVNGKDAEGRGHTYIWVSTGEQLKGIQQYYQQETDAGRKTDILSYNFALKNDIDASNVTDYKAIGSGEGNEYTGTFDGRDNRIIGLDTTKTSNGSSQTLTNAGIFDTIGADGTVEDLRVYSGTFTGTDNAGAVAGVNNGNISNVTTFGNVVESAKHAGGIAGENSGTISGASAIGTSTVTADKSGGVAGGIAGTNSGTISDSSANSAVDSSSGGAAALGGVAGVNEGTLDNVDSLGVTTGIYQVGEHNPGVGTQYSDNVGGIAGTNSGTVTNVYNESIVSGRNNVGGILGENSGKNVSNVANASDVTGESAVNDSEYVGGLVGDNKGSITNGRNNGKITGNNYVGGLVGANGAGSTLTNLVNDSAAAITGDKWVGGIAGSNAGKITASSVDEDGHVIEGNDNLINRGTITGQQYVGGVAGVNTGTIANTNNDVDLHVKDSTAVGKNAPQYFGGVVGWNKQAEDDSGNPVRDEAGNPIIGTITNATNHANVSADGASYVGGVVGKNDGTLEGMNGNYGNVTGKDFVGGVAGQNNTDVSGVTATNAGTVTATAGGAGGIFGEMNGNVGSDDASVTTSFTNSGTVISKNGEATGGFASTLGSKDKQFTVINSSIVNDGIVIGGKDVGGLIGINYATVSKSDMYSTTNAQVVGLTNVGGLVGRNYGSIEGGREDANGKDSGFYTNQIYNNGTVTGGTWTDENNDNVVDASEIKVADGNVASSAIGGLIGNNAQENGKTGSLTAGYNTGVIHAGGSDNVGGIAGTNEGTLDQVFNTVITGVNEDGANVYGSITGHTNVGGIAGTNSDTGTISNAYNTTGVTGTAEDAVTGFIAGTNSNTAGDSISNVYSTIEGNLVGGTNTTVTHGYNTNDEGNWKNSSSYKGFDFDSTDNDGTESIWKIYEGSTNPLLKVFLTKITVYPDKLPDFAADGSEHTLDVGDLIQSGALTAPGGIRFDAFEKNPILIQSNGHSAMGTYNDWLYSMQIAASGEGGTFNPNLLGYDIDLELGIGLPPDTVEPPVNEHWNFLFDDNPWDRNRDFRERKAEVHFVAGGMTL